MGLKTRLLASGKTEDNEFNISLLGFKIAVNDGLTVFNLVDGIVDEFHDESGTDESEGSNDHYCATSDAYSNNSTPTTASSGFTTTTITNPETSTAGTNPTYGSGESGTFTVPCGVTSVSMYAWGAGGSSGGTHPNPSPKDGGGGGYSEGVLAVTGGQTLHILAGEGGEGNYGSPVSGYNPGIAFKFGGNRGSPGCDPDQGVGGGLNGIFSSNIGPLSAPQISAPGIYMIAGSGGGSGDGQSNDEEGLPAALSGRGGSGGGLTGFAGGNTSAQVSAIGNAGGGGDQEQGGAAGPGTAANGQAGSFLTGGGGANPGHSGGGGAGYYGGGGGARGDSPGGPQASADGVGGGGSSYYGHPQITSGATTAGGVTGESGGASSPLINEADTGEGGTDTGANNADVARSGEDGFVLLQTSGITFAGPGGGSSTIVSNTFTSSSVPTTSRIVVFEENVDTPTLNTDIIASISRDGGSTYTTATLTDSGYVTGSSGQRILTGQAAISGQPSGQSMRWKLALANNTVKIHGVSLQWS